MTPRAARGPEAATTVLGNAAAQARCAGKSHRTSGDPESAAEYPRRALWLRGRAGTRGSVPALLDQVLAQATGVDTLQRALASGRVHHALLIDGPTGIGKTLAAFGFAQALVCERREVGNAHACGLCSACMRAVPRGDRNLTAHPDVLVIARNAYDAAVIGRRTPEAQEISIDQIRTIALSRVAFAPHEGRARIFLIRDAEELSTAAANALLKTLEEPPRGTYFILVTSQPGMLLPTIRSRAQRIRFGFLPDAVVAEIAIGKGFDPTLAHRLAPLAGGSAEALIALADPETARLLDAFVDRAIDAIDAPHLGPALELAIEAKGAKGAVEGNLVALAARLASEGRALGPRAMRAAARHQLVVAAVAEIGRNASTQLAVEAMFIKLRRT